MNYLHYVKYNLWANESLVKILEAQSDEVLDQNLISSFPTIRKTIFHIADAQHIWLLRLRGVSPADWPSKSLSNDQAIPALRNTSSAFEEFLSSQEDSFFEALCAYTTLDQKVYHESNGNIIMHCMNHSTFHRGQLITLLRQTGLEGKIPSTDLITYLREKR